MTEWITLARTDDILPGQVARAEINETAVAIFNCAGQFFVIDDTCSHAQAALSDGDLDIDRCAIECPLHGSAFDLRTGDPLSLPAVEPVRTYPVDITDGEIRVEVTHE